MMFGTLLFLSLTAAVVNADASSCVCQITRGGRTVNCDGKNLTQIPECVPSTVRNLLLSSNPITIDKNTFTRFTVLEHLQMRKTKIAPLQEDYFHGLRNLGWLSLGWNNISEVPPKMFKNLPKLYHLDLWANSLSSLPNNQFEFANKLSNINLDYNHLVSVNSTVFSNLPNLQKLGLRKNWWNCDCTLRDLYRSLQNIPVDISDEPECLTPPEVKGNRLSAVLENLTC